MSHSSFFTKCLRNINTCEFKQEDTLINPENLNKTLELIKLWSHYLLLQNHDKAKADSFNITEAGYLSVSELDLLIPFFQNYGKLSFLVNST